VRHTGLAPAFLTSLLVHATGLLGVALLWGSLQLHTARPDLIPAEGMIALPPAPEPVPVPDAEPLIPPTAVTRADVVLAQPLPRVPTAPLTPAHVEPIPPPRKPPKKSSPSPPNRDRNPYPRRNVRCQARHRGQRRKRSRSPSPVSRRRCPMRGLRRPEPIPWGHLRQTNRGSAGEIRRRWGGRSRRIV
jgi:hypothetical protein